jgi:hypothetical protein
MKALRLLGLLAMMALALSFTACSDDDDKLDGISQQELMGVWVLAPLDKNATMTDAPEWTFNEDNTCTCFSGESGRTTSFTYKLLNHGTRVQLIDSDKNKRSFITGRLSKDEIIWREILEPAYTSLVLKLVRIDAITSN